MKERKEIEKLIAEHMIAWHKNAQPAFKEHYLVTPENLADFIDTYFIKRKTAKKWKDVLKDSVAPPLT